MYKKKAQFSFYMLYFALDSGGHWLNLHKQMLTHTLSFSVLLGMVTFGSKR